MNQTLSSVHIIVYSVCRFLHWFIASIPRSTGGPLANSVALDGNRVCGRFTQQIISKIICIQSKAAWLMFNLHRFPNEVRGRPFAHKCWGDLDLDEITLLPAIRSLIFTNI